MNWDRLAALRTPLLMLLAILVLVGGVGTGVFLISVPAGFITVGILGALALAFLAYAVDPTAGAPIPVSPPVGRLDLDRVMSR